MHTLTPTLTPNPNTNPNLNPNNISQHRKTPGFRTPLPSSRVPFPTATRLGDESDPEHLEHFAKRRSVHLFIVAITVTVVVTVTVAGGGGGCFRYLEGPVLKGRKKKRKKKESKILTPKFESIFRTQFPDLKSESKIRIEN